MLFSDETVFRKFRFSMGADDITIVVRQPTSSELNQFLAGRYIQRRNKTINRHHEARTAFVSGILVDLEGAAFTAADGTVKPLNKDTVLNADDKAKWSALFGAPVESWRDFVLPQWRNTIAMAFEENAVMMAFDETGEGEDDFPLPR